MEKRSLNHLKYIGAAMIFVAGILAMAVPAAAATITVTSAQDELPIDTHNGTCTLREAITAANTNQKVDACAAGENIVDTILLQPLSYILKDAIKVSSAVTVKGKESTEIDPKTGKPKRTTLMRSSADPKKFNLVLVKDGGVLSLDTLLLTGGDTDAGVGGAIKVDAGQLNSINVGFVGNKALQGGAIYAFNSKIALSDVLFNGNFAKDGGGAIRVFGGGLTITNGQFEKNSSGASNGGAVFADSTALLFDKTLFSQNSAGVNGAALFVSGSSAPQLASIVNATFHKNSAGGVGGAIYSLLNGKSLNVVNTALVENSAKDGGAAYIAGKASFVNATLAKNTAIQTGGAVVAKNTAQISFTHVTIAENVAQVSGGGILAESNAKVEIMGSVITGNTAEDSAKDYAGPFVSKGYNLISQVPTNFGQFEANSTDIVGKWGETAPFEMAQVLLGLLGSQKPAAWYYPLVMVEGLTAVNKDGSDYCKYFNLCLEEKVVDGQVFCALDKMIQPLLADQVGTPRDGQCDSGSIEYGVVVAGAEVPAASQKGSEDADHPAAVNDHPAATGDHTVATTSDHPASGEAAPHVAVVTSDSSPVSTETHATTTESHPTSTDTHTAVETHAADSPHVGVKDSREHALTETVASHGVVTDSHVAATHDTSTLPQVTEKPVSSESWMDSVLGTNVKPLTSTGTIDQFIESAATASATKGVHGSETLVATRDSHTTAPHPAAMDIHVGNSQIPAPHLIPESHSGNTPHGAVNSHDTETHGAVGVRPSETSTHSEKASTHALDGLVRATGHAAAPAQGAIGHPILGSEKVAKEMAKEVDAQNSGTLSVDIPQGDAQKGDAQKSGFASDSPLDSAKVPVGGDSQMEMPAAYTQGEIVAVNEKAGSLPNLPSMGNGNESFQGTPAEAPGATPAAAAPAAGGASGGCSLIR